MQSLLVDRPAGHALDSTNYSFVNWVRLVAMFSIVYEHSLLLSVTGQSQVRVLHYMSQPLKFGTICFFMISGYLLGHKLAPSASPWGYYRRRLLVVGLPFTIAFGLYYLKKIGIFGRLSGKPASSNVIDSSLLDQLYTNLFDTSYWFVFSFLIALATLLLVWRYTTSPLVGWISFAVTCFFALNVYGNWFNNSHTIAMPAYIFYLWLGVWLARNNQVMQRLRAFPRPLLTAILLLTLGLACLESELLWYYGVANPVNTLKPTNQLFSVVAFGWLIRHNTLKRLTPWLKPRNESFGIYLYHPFFVGILASLATHWPILHWLSDPSPIYYGPGKIVLVDLVRVGFVYGTTLGFVKIINRTRLRWLFGERP